jgi:glucokinase
MLLPVHTGNAHKIRSGQVTLLAGDAGGTKTNLALFACENDQYSLVHEARFASNEYTGILPLTEEFLRNHPFPDRICIGVAGPVLNGHARLSNIDWEIDRDEISSHFGVPDVFVINDLEANAYGLSMLGDKDIAVIHKGWNATPGNAAVIAPGTGLGEAGLFWDGHAYRPFATEGGHCDFASRSEFDFALFRFLQRKYHHVSWERVVSGPGIVSIYHFLRDELKRDEPGWLKELFYNGDTAEIISGNVSRSEICRETMQHFVRYLAYESANLVLKFNATGGLFVGGGIAPRIVSMFENNAFYAPFCEIGRLHYLTEKVPVSILLNPKTALLGAAYYGANH